MTVIDSLELMYKWSRMLKRSNTFILLAVIFLVIGVVGLCIACGMYYATRMSEREYGIVFDAGSSHTSMYLYKWESDKEDGTGKVEQISSCDVDGGGLSSYIDTPSKAGGSIVKCLGEAANRIPWVIKKYSPVYLGATAGMRIAKLQNQTLSDEVFDSVRDTVSASGFLVQNIKQQIKILSGFEEGVGLWVTVNYVAGTLGVMMFPQWSLLPTGKSATLGVLDLGGASTQLAFELPANASVPRNRTGSLSLFSHNLRIFSESFLCFGALEMRHQVLAILAKQAGYQGNVSHPCMAVGYNKNTTYEEVFQSTCTKDYRSSNITATTMTIIGSGDNVKCNEVMVDLFNMSSFAGGTLMPAVPDRFLARGAFAYTMKDLKALDRSNQVNYTKFVSAMKTFCDKPYSSIKVLKLRYPSAVCTNAHYIHYLLSSVYKFPDNQWSGILFTNKLNDVDMGWTLGYMTNITTTLPRVPKLELYNITTPVFAVVVGITSLLIVLGIIAIIFAWRYRREQYQSLDQNQNSQPT